MSKVDIVWAKKDKGVIFQDIEEGCKIWRKTDLLLGKWHEEFGKFSPEHSKVSKLELWWDPFAQSRKCMTLTFTWGIDMRNFTNFDPSTPKSKKFVLIGSLWPKYILFKLKSTEELSFITLKIYANFEEKLTCAVVWKKTWEIWQIFTRASTWKCQNWDFDGILWSKVEKVWP